MVLAPRFTSRAERPWNAEALTRQRWTPVRRGRRTPVTSGDGRSRWVARLLWGGGAALLCPCCRDEVQADREGDDLTSCERCGTLHHRACFDEPGDCTIFGCAPRDAREAERA